MSDWGLRPWRSFKALLGYLSAQGGARRTRLPARKTERATKKQSRSDAIRALGKTVRLRDKDHRRFVLRQACLVCGRVPLDPHHLTFTQPRALGRRVSDEFIVPVCRVHHRELHRSGNDDPKLWKNARLDEGRTNSPASQGAAGDGASETPA